MAIMDTTGIEVKVMGTEATDPEKMDISKPERVRKYRFNLNN